MFALRKVSRWGTAMVYTAVLLALLLGSAGAQVGDIYEEIKWEALVPKGWDPAKEFRGVDFSKFKDGDPRATEMLQKMKALWEMAPTENSLNGRKVRIPGFVLPLDQSESMKTFLLVPYFGACIHTPPPPANQIIQVTLAKPVKGFRSMDAVWINGTMEVFRSDSPWGAVAYRLKGVKVDPYKQ